MPRSGVCAFAEASGCPAHRARLLWHAALDTSVLRVAARPISSPDRDAFDLAALADIGTIVVMPDGRGSAVISDGYRHIRLDVELGTLRLGPVLLTSMFDGLIDIDAKILTLRRLVALHRLGRFARGLHPRERVAPRWIMALRAHDAERGGASQRELAMVLFGTSGIDSEWNKGANFRRLRVQRLTRVGRTMIQGGYRGLLR